MNGVPRAQGNARPPDAVVMKFGGTSVEDAAAIRRMVRIVQSRGQARRAVVVSALAKITDQLLSAAEAAAQGQVEYSTATLASLKLRHQAIATELLEASRGEFCKYLDSAFDGLTAATCGAAAAGQLTPRDQDAIVSVGEHISSRLAAAVLRESGVNAVHVDAAECIVTDSVHTQASPLPDLTNENLQSVIVPLLEAGAVPVLGGFIARTQDGTPTTLGRGGSDFTAALVGAAVKAGLIEIWTDVDGIMTSDPKVCSDARRISHMSFEEAADLAHFGAKVLHPATLLPAMHENIPVHVLNSRNSVGEGTQIMARVNSGSVVRAVTAKRGVAAVEVELAASAEPEGLRLVCSAFDRHHCPIEMVSASRGRVSLVVGATSALPRVAADLHGVASVTWENHKALVCLVGENVRRQPGVASRVFAAVSDLEVRVVCQGGSDRTLSFLVEESKAEESVRRLHAVFFSDRKQPVSAKLNSAALCQAGEAWR